jgi:hypothetical protein
VLFRSEDARRLASEIASLQTELAATAEAISEAEAQEEPGPPARLLARTAAQQAAA